MARKFFPIVVLSLAFALIMHEQDTFEPDSIGGKRVLVTGTSSGIGEALAYQYSKLGARIVVIAARRDELLGAVELRCVELGAQQVDVVVADLGRPEERRRVAGVIEQKFEGRLDHVILNHAGTSQPGMWLGTPENVTFFQDEFNINFVSYVDLTSRLLPALTASRGHVGIVSSVAGKIGLPTIASQSAGTFALDGFFSALRQELTHRDTGITVTLCVLPRRHIRTDRAATPEGGQKFFPATLFSPASVDDAAMAIIKGVTKGSYEIYIPRFVWFLVHIHKFLPGYIADLLADRHLVL